MRRAGPRSFLAGMLLLGALPLAAVGATRAEGSARDMGSVLHPAGAAPELLNLAGNILLVSQSIALVLVVGGLLIRLREHAAQMENIAGMMLRVGFIATIPLWQNLLAVSSDYLAEAVGGQAVLSFRLSEPEKAPTQEMSELQERLHKLECQWMPSGGAALDVLEDARKVEEGGEDAWLQRSWNWARVSSLPKGGERVESSWAVQAGVERAASVQRLLAAVSLSAHAAQMTLFFAENIRLQCFLLGFALLPLFIASLGVPGLDSLGRKVLQALGLLALWPLGWAFCHAASRTMLASLLELMNKNSSSALNPKVADEALRTLSQAAPYLSWGNLLFLAALSVALCLWVFVTVVGVPLLLHLACSASTRFRAA